MSPLLFLPPSFTTNSSSRSRLPFSSLSSLLPTINGFQVLTIYLIVHPLLPRNFPGLGFYFLFSLYIAARVIFSRFKWTHISFPPVLLRYD